MSTFIDWIFYSSLVYSFAHVVRYWRNRQYYPLATFSLHNTNSLINESTFWGLFVLFCFCFYLSDESYRFPLFSSYTLVRLTLLWLIKSKWNEDNCQAQTIIRIFSFFSVFREIICHTANIRAQYFNSDINIFSFDQMQQHENWTIFGTVHKTIFQNSFVIIDFV